MSRKKIYSENFRRDRVRLLQKGKTTPRELKERYWISNASIYRWLNQYGDLEKDERILFA